MQEAVAYRRLKEPAREHIARPKSLNLWFFFMSDGGGNGFICAHTAIVVPYNSERFTTFFLIPRGILSRNEAPAFASDQQEMRRDRLQIVRGTQSYSVRKPSMVL